MNKRIITLAAHLHSRCATSRLPMLLSPKLDRYSPSDTLDPRGPRNRLAVIRLLIVLGELAFVSIYSAVFWENFLYSRSLLTPFSVSALAMLSGVLTSAYRRVLAPPGRQTTEEAWRAALITAVSVTTACSTVILFGSLMMPASTHQGLGVWAVGWIVTTPVAAGFLRYAIEQAACRAGARRIKAVAISTSAEAKTLTQAALRMPYWDWLSFYQSDRCGDVSGLVALVKSGLVDVVVLHFSIVETRVMEDILGTMADMPVRICLAFEASHFSLVGQNSGLILTDVAVTPLRPMQIFAKRLIDIALSIIVVIVTLPVLLLTAAAIRLETKGSPLYRQWRAGQNGEPFQAFKLRTMYSELCDTTAQRQTLINDARVTWVGRFLRKTSIDELPQLINVLRGEMSLVGPRAHPLNMKVEGRDYADVVRQYRARHRIKPGITGWAQVNGSRGGISNAFAAHRRVELDLFYLRNWSLLLDLEILCRTIIGGFIARDD